MKFQQLTPFIHHFTSSFPQHLSPVYFIVCPNEQERKKILNDLAAYFDKGWDCKRASSAKEALMHLSSLSLLSEHLAAVCDESEQIYQHTYELLEQFVENPPAKTLLLLGLSWDKQIAELYKRGKKEIVVLDLSQEKPWERKERLKQEIIEYISREQKKISSEALDAFFERLPLDRPLLLQEVEKILCFTLERPKIEKEDIEKICSISLEMSHFQMAEQIVWGKLEIIPKMDDLAYLLPLISSLRHHLEIGLSICALSNQENPKQAIASAFPQLSLKNLEKYLRLVHTRQEAFFLHGLNQLFALELGVKTSFGPPEILFSRFYAALLGDKQGIHS